MPLAPEDRLPLTRLAQTVLGDCEVNREPDLALARVTLAALEQRIDRGRADLRPLAEAVRIEIGIVAAEEEPDAERPGDPLFRLRAARWAVTDEDFAKLRPVPAANLRLVAFDYDASQFLGVRTAEQLPTAPVQQPSYAAAFKRSPTQRREPLLIDDTTARIISLSDGIRSVSQIVNELRDQADDIDGADYAKWIEELFLDDLLRFPEAP
jgi:hypothetical protein